MRSSPWLTLVALVAALPGCGKDSATGPKNFKIFDCANGSHYAIGQTVNGSLSNTDCLDPIGQGHADYYQFTVATTGPVAITVSATSGASPRVINAILNSNGDVTHARFTNLDGSSTVGGVLAAGTYVAVVGASEQNQTSTYTLTSSATAPAIFDCSSITPIAIGATVTGTFAATDCADPDGYAPADYYSFTLTQAGPITARLTPAAGSSAWVYVGDEQDFIYGYDVSSPGTPVVLSGTLQPGRYIVIASADDEAQTSGYTLELTNVLTTTSGASKPSPLSKQAPVRLRRLPRW